MADNQYNLIKKRVISVVSTLSGMSVVVNFDEFVQAGLSYPRTIIEMNVNNNEPRYFRHQTSKDMEAEGIINIKTLTQSKYDSQVSDSLNTWRIAIENALDQDATLQGYCIDFYKQSEQESIFKDNNYGLLDQDYYVRYYYNHGGT